MGRHGVNDFEQSRSQPFEVDLDLHVDLRRAGQSDVLEETVNYSEACKRAVGVVEGESFLLLERLAQRVADELLALDGVESVEVSVRKLRPPVTLDVRTTGVRIVRP